VAILYLDGKRFKQIIQAGAEWVSHNRDHLNKINVFPVPDGDTGTNMSMTLAAAVREINALKEVSLETTVKAAAWGGLMGARGNSGIIMAQILSGLAESVVGLERFFSKDIATAFLAASTKAYKAVLNPAEGTILTVIREAAEAAVVSVESQKDLTTLLDIMVKSAKSSVERTPLLLPKLKEAGVVDAGGLGFTFFIEGMLRLIQGATSSTGVNGDDAILTEITSEETDHHWNFRFCTEFILKGSRISEEDVKSSLSSMGDSIVVVGDSRLARVHIHTGEPDEVLRYAASLGQVSSIKVDDMLVQHTNRFESSNQEKATSVIAVALGDGFKELFYHEGAELVVDGGPTQNPSTADIISAIEAVASSNIILLPNHKNIYPAALQAAERVSKKTTVMKTNSVAEGIAALLAYMEEASTEENILRMEQAFSKIKVAEVAEASRDANLNEIEVRTGDSIGMFRGKVECSCPLSNDAVSDLIDRMVDESDEIITLYYGVSISKRDAKDVVTAITEKFPDKDVELYFGGQPYSQYIIAVE
jgi:uncharacterized protein